MPEPLPAPPDVTSEVTLAEIKAQLRADLQRDKREQELRDDLAAARAALTEIAAVAKDVGDAMHIARRWWIPVLIALGGGGVGLDVLGEKVGASASEKTAQEAP